MLQTLRSSRRGARIARDYRQKSRLDEALLCRTRVCGFLGVTDSIPALTTGGVPVRLVCVELDARECGGPYMGPRRIFGFTANGMSAPQERSNIDLQNEDCDRPQLTWREWRVATSEWRRARKTR